MKLNITSQYAIRILSCIANNPNKKHNAKELSQMLEVPYKYLTKVMTALVDAQLVISSRGREGGYILTRLPQDISLKEILIAVKEDLQETHCLLKNQTCNEKDKCILHDEWQKPKELIHCVLLKKSLKDLKRQK